VRLKRFLEQERPLVVYSEGASYRPHLAPIAEEYASRGHPVAYVTSEKADYLAPFQSGNISSFYIGDGVRRIWFFQTVDCDVFLMTMPDLDQLHLKRSLNPVHYVYTQHSLSSLHMVYRDGAFDSYDTIFAAGPHHVQEVRALEKMRGTTPKKVIEQGYVFLDDLTRFVDSQSTGGDSSMDDNEKRTVLVAPSWGPNGLIERHGEAVVRNILDSGLKVILRPHPRTLQLSPKTVERLRQIFSSETEFEFDSTPSPLDSYSRSDILVTSWSGSAFEYAMAFGKPVVHIDVPRKTRNVKYSEVPLEPFEISYRGRFGMNVDENQIRNLGSFVLAILAEHGGRTATVADFRASMVFGAKAGAVAAADYLAELVFGR